MLDERLGRVHFWLTMVGFHTTFLVQWATSCPPPLRNFDRMPRICSERPAFDAKFPHLAVTTAGPPGVESPPARH